MQGWFKYKRTFCIKKIILHYFQKHYFHSTLFRYVFFPLNKRFLFFVFKERLGTGIHSVTHELLNLLIVLKALSTRRFLEGPKTVAHRIVKGRDCREGVQGQSSVFEPIFGWFGLQSAVLHCHARVERFDMQLDLDREGHCNRQHVLTDNHGESQAAKLLEHLRKMVVMFCGVMLEWSECFAWLKFSTFSFPLLNSVCRFFPWIVLAIGSKFWLV